MGPLGRFGRRAQGCGVLREWWRSETHRLFLPEVPSRVGSGHAGPVSRIGVERTVFVSKGVRQRKRGSTVETMPGRIIRYLHWTAELFQDRLKRWIE